MYWKDQLKENVTSVSELKKYIHLTPMEEETIRKVIKIHPMSISKYYLSLINREDKSDPIRKLVVPSKDELNLAGTYDTSGEKENTKSVGLQHKYSQTALLLATNRCASYCRFCFRKRLVGLSTKEILNRFDEAIDYIEKHNEINNVLISGGDPLTLPTRVLKKLLDNLADIEHLNFVRIGSRVPVVFPDRITQDKSLLKSFRSHSFKRKRLFIVTHFNHPREITTKSIHAINALINSNVIVNNQTVLLKGVNDNPDVLAELMNKLVSIGVNPYYVFQCRPVKRVKKQFQVPLSEGCKIIEEAKKQMNGHSKRFKYAMSHKRGKIEILGLMDGYIYFKQHQARNPEELGKIFRRKADKTSGWLNNKMQLY
jgi:KamA family protein